VTDHTYEGTALQMIFTTEYVDNTQQRQYIPSKEKYTVDIYINFNLIAGTYERFTELEKRK